MEESDAEGQTEKNLQHGCGTLRRSSNNESSREKEADAHCPLLNRRDR